MFVELESTAQDVVTCRRERLYINMDLVLFLWVDDDGSQPPHRPRVRVRYAHALAEESFLIPGLDRPSFESASNNLDAFLQTVTP